MNRLEYTIFLSPLKCFLFQVPRVCRWSSNTTKVPQ